MSPREDRTTTVSAMKGWLLEATYLLRVADSTKSWPNVTVTHFSSKAEQLVNVAVNARVFTFSVVLVRSAFGVRRIRAFPNFHQQIQEEDLDYQHRDFIIGHLVNWMRLWNRHPTTTFLEEGERPYQVNWQTCGPQAAR